MSVKSTVARTRSGSLDRRRAREELLDLVEHGLAVSGEGVVIDSCQLDPLGVGDVLGQVPARLDRDDAVARAVEDECGHPDRGQDVTDVDLHRDVEPGSGRRRRAREAAGL